MSRHQSRAMKAQQRKYGRQLQKRVNEIRTAAERVLGFKPDVRTANVDNKVVVQLSTGENGAVILAQAVGDVLPQALYSLRKLIDQRQLGAAAAASEPG